MWEAVADFSRALRREKANYLAGEAVDGAVLDQFRAMLAGVSWSGLATDAQRLAFWINVYNAAVCDLVIRLGLRVHMREVEDIFTHPHLEIGGLLFSLDDIEHGILRRLARPQFAATDPRAALLPARLDYRIHFALNCGARSCPPIAAYSPHQLDTQLQAAEAAYVASEFVVDVPHRRLVCSQLFEWYRADFVGCYLNDPAYVDYEVTLTPYDWGLA